MGAPVQPGAATLGREEEGSEAGRRRWRTMAAALGFLREEWSGAMSIR
jgi:hypothetical protein